MHPDHRVPFVKGVVTIVLHDMHRGYLRLIKLQGTYLMIIMKRYANRLVKLYGIDPATLYKQRLALQRTLKTDYALTQFSLPIIFDIGLADMCIHTMGTMRRSKDVKGVPLLHIIGYNLQKAFLLMGKATAPQTKAQTLMLIHKYRMTTDEVALLLNIRHLAPFIPLIHVDDYPLPQHYLPLLSHLRCTSGEVMNIMRPQSSVMHFTDLSDTQDLTYRLMMTPYNDHQYMFNATANQPKEERIPYIGDRADRNLKLDELSFFRGRLYPYYEGMAIGSYTFPEGRRRSFLEIATDPEFYKALERDELTVLDIAHMQGMNLGQFKTLIVDVSLYIDNWVHFTNSKERPNFSDDFESYYRDFRNGRVGFSEIPRYRYHLWTFIRDVIPFCKLFFIKYKRLQLDIFDSYGIDPLNDIISMHKIIGHIRKINKL